MGTPHLLLSRINYDIFSFQMDYYAAAVDGHDKVSQ